MAEDANREITTVVDRAVTAARAGRVGRRDVGRDVLRQRRHARRRDLRHGPEPARRKPRRPGVEARHDTGTPAWLSLPTNTPEVCAAIGANTLRDEVVAEHARDALGGARTLAVGVAVPDADRRLTGRRGARERDACWSRGRGRSRSGPPSWIWWMRARVSSAGELDRVADAGRRCRCPRPPRVGGDAGRPLAGEGQHLARRGGREGQLGPLGRRRRSLAGRTSRWSPAARARSPSGSSAASSATGDDEGDQDGPRSHRPNPTFRGTATGSVRGA